jgi:hypothetical protein
MVPESSHRQLNQTIRTKQANTLPRKGKTMQIRFRIPAFYLFLISLALLGRPEKGYAQITDYNTWTTSPTADIQQFYVNFALHSSTGVNFATDKTNGLKYVTLELGGPNQWNDQATCLELTTSIATTGYPSTHIWFTNGYAHGTIWQSLSSGLTNYLRVFAENSYAPGTWLYIYAGSSSTNNRDFNYVIRRVVTPNRTSSECQVAGKPFLDFTRIDANDFFYTANTN